MAKNHRNKLLVEGEEDKRVVPYFMEKFISWPDDPKGWPVYIESFNGINGILKEGVISAELKSPGLEALGIIVDADANPTQRWQQIRDRVRHAFPNIPDDLPIQGLITSNAEGLRFGVWVMPDNSSVGMLESFLQNFVPTDDPLWKVIEDHCSNAKQLHKAPFIDAHLDKAKIHSWLALQNPPGQSLHVAVITNTLNPNSPLAAPFVDWFKDLFQVD